MHTYHRKKQTPRIFSFFSHTKLQNVRVQYCFRPYYIASDFCLFITRPETRDKLLVMDSAWDISCSFPQSKVMSSAYEAIFNTCSKSVPFTTSRRVVIPLIPFRSLIFIANNSVERTKARGEKGYHCGIPESQKSRKAIHNNSHRFLHLSLKQKPI